MNLRLLEEVLSSKDTDSAQEEGSPKVKKCGPGNQVSIRDLINFSKDKVEHKIFKIINEGEEQKLNRYVQIKFKKFHMNNQEKQMLQIIDVSASILYD